MSGQRLAALDLSLSESGQQHPAPGTRLYLRGEGGKKKKSKTRQEWGKVW
jgi:hypothetical protein